MEADFHLLFHCCQLEYWLHYEYSSLLSIKMLVMLPEIPSNNSLSSGLGSLASMAGVKLGNGDSEDAIYPEFYPKVVKTPDFLVALLNKPVRPKGLKQDVSLFIYLTQHQKAPWWDGLFQWGGLGSKEAPTNKIDPQRLTKGTRKITKGVRLLHCELCR